MTSTAPILIVDDDPGLRALVAASLELEGHSVLTAADGSIALNVMESLRPGLILLDKAMPKLDGPAFARELRARGFDVPIIVISGSDGGRMFAREISADGFIRKPFKVPQLLDTVSDCITRLANRGNTPGESVAGA